MSWILIHPQIFGAFFYWFHSFFGQWVQLLSVGSTHFFGWWVQFLSSQFLRPLSIGSLIFFCGEFNYCLHNSCGLFLLVHSFFWVVSSIIVFTIFGASFYWFHTFFFLFVVGGGGRVQLMSSQFLLLFLFQMGPTSWPKLLRPLPVLTTFFFSSHKKHWNSAWFYQIK